MTGPKCHASVITVYMYPGVYTDHIPMLCTSVHHQYGTVQTVLGYRSQLSRDFNAVNMYTVFSLASDLIKLN